MLTFVDSPSGWRPPYPGRQAPQRFAGAAHQQGRWIWPIPSGFLRRLGLAWPAIFARGGQVKPTGPPRPRREHGEPHDSGSHVPKQRLAGGVRRDAHDRRGLHANEGDPGHGHHVEGATGMAVRDAGELGHQHGGKEPDGERLQECVRHAAASVKSNLDAVDGEQGEGKRQSRQSNVQHSD